MVEALSTDVLQRALRAGVKDVLAAPVEAGELALAVERVGGTLAPVTPTTLATEASGPRPATAGSSRSSRPRVARASRSSP